MADFDTDKDASAGDYRLVWSDDQDARQNQIHSC